MTEYDITCLTTGAYQLGNTIPAPVRGLDNANVTKLTFKLVVNACVHGFWGSATIKKLTHLQHASGSLVHEEPLQPAPVTFRRNFMAEGDDHPKSPDMEEVLIMQMIRALSDGEVTGGAKDDFVYTVFWQSLRRSEQMRRMVKRWNPRWYKVVDKILEEDMQVTTSL